MGFNRLLRRVEPSVFRCLGWFYFWANAFSLGPSAHYLSTLKPRRNIEALKVRAWARQLMG